MSPVYIGIHGRVLALDRTTGKRLWETALKGTQFVNVHLDGDLLIATASGEVFGLDAKTGEVRWQDALRGLGLGMISIATASGSTGSVEAQHALDQQGAVIATTVIST